VYKSQLPTKISAKFREQMSRERPRRAALPPAQEVSLSYSFCMPRLRKKIPSLNWVFFKKIRLWGFFLCWINGKNHISELGVF